jgi:hypothetical protein
VSSWTLRSDERPSNAAIGAPIARRVHGRAALPRALRSHVPANPARHDDRRSLAPCARGSRRAPRAWAGGAGSGLRIGGMAISSRGCCAVRARNAPSGRPRRVRPSVSRDSEPRDRAGWRIVPGRGAGLPIALPSRQPGGPGQEVRPVHTPRITPRTWSTQSPLIREVRDPMHGAERSPPEGRSC